MSVQPFEILGGPLEIYTAPVGEAFPTLDTAPPGGNWTLMGLSGSKNYSEDGVTISPEQEIELVRALGLGAPVKARRTTEDLILSVTVMDLTVEQVSLALNGNTITTVVPGSGTVGTREVELSQGLEVTQYALLIRGVSPYIVNTSAAPAIAQYQVPVVVVSGSPEIVYVKGEDVAGIEMEFTAIADPNAATDAEIFGQYIVADVVALP